MQIVKCKRWNGRGACCLIESETIVSKSIELRWEGDYNNSYIDHLSMRNCTIVEFPQNLKDETNSLNYLEIVDCRLRSFERKHIQGIPYLKSILVVNCGLKSLSNDVFEGLEYLEMISLYGNKLEEIGPHVFDGLKSLKWVDLRGNANIDMWYDKDDAGSSTLHAIKNEIIGKCKPRASVDPKAVNRALHYATIFPVKQKRSPDEVQLTDLRRFFADPAFKDFTVSIGEISFKVHKALFAARSPTLAELFRTNPEAQELNLRDIPESTFKAVYDFIYSNQLPGDVNHLEVFVAAGRLKIEDLKEVAAAHLLTALDENNSFEVLLMSNKFEHDLLRKKAFESICAKVFPDRQLDDELARQPEKLRKFIDTKKKLDMEFEEISKKK